MLRLRNVSRLWFGRGKAKKNKDKWGDYDEFLKKFENNFYASRNTGEDNPDEWLTPDKIKALVKNFENHRNFNRISNPMDIKMKRKLGEFKLHYQYFEVNFGV